jgi:hypothetical protein
MGDSTLDDDERTMRDWVDAVTERDEWNACIPQWITALLARLEVARSELRTLRAENERLLADNEMLRGDVQMLRDIVTKLETHND